MSQQVLSSRIDITFGQTTLTLLAERAAYSAAEQTLFVADTHFGKDATFRRGGVPVPLGSTDATLGRITNLIEQTNAGRLVILGDMFHARSSLSKETKQSLETFFERHDSIEMMLIRGNHDVHVGRLPATWPIEVLSPVARVGRIALGHEPTDAPDDADVLLCGHIHPAVKLSGRQESIGRLPCFWHSRGNLIFPAIGDFTGMHTIRPKTTEQAWGIAEGSIFALK